VYNIINFAEKMAEQQHEHEQMMRDVQRAYVDFLDDSDEQGIYDRLVRYVRRYVRRYQQHGE
jgi:hypothetical protein